ncbi:MAG: tetratricopeptide repeat protein [Pseudomonadota bacterium]
MMNLLARILSHGFAFAVVAIIIIVLMYRGELSPEWELPEFLVIKSQPGTTEEADSGGVGGSADEATLPADSSVVTPEPPAESEEPLAPAPATAASSDIPPVVTPESPEEPMIPGVTDATSNEAPPADEIPATGQADDVAPAASSDPVSATDTHTAEATDETTTTEPAASTGSTDQTTDDTPAPKVDVLPDEPGTTVDDSLSTVTEETAPADIAPTAADEITPAAAEPLAEEVAPVETAPTAAGEPESTSEVVPATEPPAAPDKEDATKAVDDAATETPYEVMAKAREAYWLRDFDAAEQHYRKLIQIDPDNPDGYGEMGNMYFSQGKWDEAAAAFYEAGTRLVKDGHLVQARQMVEVIRGLNGSQADDLETQIVAVSPTSP